LSVSAVAADSSSERNGLTISIGNDRGVLLGADFGERLKIA